VPRSLINGTPTTYGWIPFGGGVRRCLGAAFAELEMRIVLSTMLRRRVMHAASPHAERAHSPQRDALPAVRHKHLTASRTPATPDRHATGHPSHGRLTAHVAATRGEREAAPPVWSSLTTPLQKRGRIL